MGTLTETIRRYNTAYDRGILTPHEFALHLVDLFIDLDPTEEELLHAIPTVPDAVILELRSELHELANTDYYRRTFGIGDARTEEEVHADALARQPKLRDICRLIGPLVLSRDLS